MTLPKAKHAPDYSRMTLKQRQRKFREYRHPLNLTQDECAKVMGWSGESKRTIVSGKENGVREATVRDLLALECLLRRARKWPVR